MKFIEGKVKIDEIVNNFKPVHGYNMDLRSCVFIRNKHNQLSIASNNGVSNLLYQAYLVDTFHDYKYGYNISNREEEGFVYVDKIQVVNKNNHTLKKYL